MEIPKNVTEGSFMNKVWEKFSNHVIIIECSGKSLNVIGEAL